MNFNRVNNIVGWIVFAVACTVYVYHGARQFLGMRRVRLSCYKLQIPTPGALFVLMAVLIILSATAPHRRAAASIS